MSKSHRREVVKRLKEQIDATTDPKQLVELTREFNKLMPRPKQVKRAPRKLAEKPTKNHSSILDNRTGSMVDNLSDGKKVLHHLVVELEKRERNTGQTLTQTERHTFWADLISSLSEREREALNNDGVA